MSAHQDSAELLPCPFCGGEAYLDETKGATGELYQCVVCTACDATSCCTDIRSMQPEESDPITAWNTRPDTTLREQRDELLEALEKFAAIEMGSDADCQVEIVPNGYSDPMMWRQHIDAARSAIAKARGAS